MTNIKEKQKDILIGFMSVNYVKLFGKFSSEDGNNKKTKLWEDLVEQLNSEGPPIKTIEKWKRSWADFKMNAKKKKQLIRAYQNRTGGGPPCETKLNDFEHRILNIIGDFCADGDTNLEEIGFSSKQKNAADQPIALNRIYQNEAQSQSLDNANCLGIRPLTVSLTPLSANSNAGRMMQMSHQSCSNVSKNGSINSTKVQSQSNQNGSMNSTKVSSQSNHSPHSLVGLVSNTQHELCDFDAETDDEVHIGDDSNKDMCSSQSVQYSHQSHAKAMKRSNPMIQGQIKQKVQILSDHVIQPISNAHAVKSNTGRMMQVSHQSSGNVSKNGSMNSTQVSSQSKQKSRSNQSTHSLAVLGSTAQHKLPDFDTEIDDEVHSRGNSQKNMSHGKAMNRANPTNQVQMKQKVQVHPNRPISKQAIQKETPNGFQVNQALTLQAQTNSLLKIIISQNKQMINLLDELVESTKD